MEPINCVICYDEIKYRVLFPCNHNDICLQCFFRSQTVYNKNECSTCRNGISSEPIITSNFNLDYQKAKNLNPKYYSEYKIFSLVDNIINLINTFSVFICDHCKMTFHVFDQFAAHLKIHQYRACRTCFDSGRFLKYECPTFHMSNYKNHLNRHPKCNFCNLILFDEKSLSDHTNQIHYRCDICAKNYNKILWFKDINQLILHIQENHYLCTYKECIENELVAFATKGELILHLNSKHKDYSLRADFSVDF